MLATLTFFLSSGEGPTGWRWAELKVRRGTQWSRLSSDPTESQQALYVHADDVAAIATGLSVGGAREASTCLMETSAEALTKAGFRVSDRRAAIDGQNIVGVRTRRVTCPFAGASVQDLAGQSRSLVDGRAELCCC